MELFKLIPSTWYPGATIQNFSSLVWSERFRDAGDFQLVMEDDISILIDLPIGTLISHTDTREVMIVENHEIDRNEDKKLVVTVSGRSFETFLENRVTAGTLLALETAGVKNNEIITNTPIIVAGTIVDYSLKSGVASAANAITNFNRTTTMRVAGTSTATQVQRGDSYSAVLANVELADAGIKTKRPMLPETTLDIILTDGLDLTVDVVFYAQAEDLKDAKYFWTIRDYKNYAQVAAKVFQHEYRTSDLGGDVTGLDRKLMYVEAAELDLAYIFGSTDAVVARRAQQEMAQHRQLAILQATISETARPKFKIDYDVGDIVFVYGEFGAVDVMRVTEHILTKDEEGIHGYPALTAV